MGYVTTGKVILDLNEAIQNLGQQVRDIERIDEEVGSTVVDVERLLSDMQYHRENLATIGCEDWLRTLEGVIARLRGIIR